MQWPIKKNLWSQFTRKLLIAKILKRCDLVAKKVSYNPIHRRAQGWEGERARGHKHRREQGWEGVRLRGHKGRRVQGQNSTRAGGFKGGRVQGQEGTNVGGHKGRRVQGHKGVRTGCTRAGVCKGKRAQGLSWTVPQAHPQPSAGMPRLSTDMSSAISSPFFHSCHLVKLPMPDNFCCLHSWCC